jgi:hypothetical protein
MHAVDLHTVAAIIGFLALVTTPCLLSMSGKATVETE